MALRDELLEEVLGLPANARAELAATLLRSLDNEADDDAEHEQAWSDELERRLREIDNGTVKLISEADALRMIDSDDSNPPR